MGDEFRELLAQMDAVTVAAIAAFILTEVLLFLTATFLTVKALILRRTTPVGAALARNNFAMALVYYDVFFALWLPILRHPYISLTLRFAVIVTTLLAIYELVRMYGGVRNTVREIRDSLRELFGICTSAEARVLVISTIRSKHKYVSVGNVGRVGSVGTVGTVGNELFADAPTSQRANSSNT
jgi:hypothetical protein